MVKRLQEEPASEEAAKAHIERIRLARSPDNEIAQTIAVQLGKALDTISDDLYPESTHFLMEIIQNADDNSYNDPMPAIEITYNGSLRIDCNETGFKAKNVEAICQVGNSTKLAKDGDNPFIGEKGIGFKSVFKVADVVYIKSRYYSFKFDKGNDYLGIITPIWSTNPPFCPRDGYTTFYLQLSPNCNSTALKHRLMELDHRMLIFLRQLRHIRIKIDSEPPIDLKRTADVQDVAGRRIEIIQDNRPQRYIVSTHMQTNLPTTVKRREGISNSEILLAFPLDTSGAPTVASQHVYAFLPIRDYGLPYLIQADWLVTASRGEIDQSSGWNRALQQGVVDATILAAHSFRRDSNLRYTWLRWLPWKASTTGFFKDTKADLFRKLREEAFLENFAGTFESPRSLVYVPSEFYGSDDVPFALTPATARTYLSKRYAVSDKDILLALGVVEMTVDIFLTDLEKMITADPQKFRNQPQKWHSKLASILRLKATGASTQTKLLSLALIPLRGGAWVQGCRETKKDIYLPESSLGDRIPNGLDLKIVEENAASDSLRQSLFRWLGAEPLDSLAICHEISTMHNQATSQPHFLSKSDILSHLLFLYNASWSNPGLRWDLWVVAEDGRKVRGKDIYVDSDLSLSATYFFRNKGSQFPFLHHDFLNAVPTHRERWNQWLVEQVGITSHPKFVRQTQSTQAFEIHPDFEYILKNHGSRCVLQLLKDYRTFYLKYIEVNPSSPLNAEPNASQYRLVARLESTAVRCIDGSDRKLHETFLPLEELTRYGTGHVPFVDVPKPQDERWPLVLRCFNVGCKNHLEFYIRCLESVKKNSTSEPPSRREIIVLLEQIQARVSDDKELVVRKFRDSNLIFIPPYIEGGRGFWVSSTSCVWDGPSFLKSVHALKQHYPDNKKLFIDVLGAYDASIETIIQETQHFTRSVNLDYIRYVFLELEKYIKDLKGEVPATTAEPLHTRSIFPVRAISESTGFSLLRSSNSSTEWFIADSAHLARSFQRRLPLLALGVSDVGRLKRVFKVAKAEMRKLSNVADCTARVVGNEMPWPSYQDALRKKANFILRLVPDTEINRRKIFRELRAVTVFKAPEVEQNWAITFEGRTIHGQSEAGCVALNSSNDALQLYFAQGFVSTSKSKRELVDRLYNFCGMNNTTLERRDLQYLLSQILDEDDTNEIIDILDRARVPELVTDEELDEEAERNNRQHFHRPPRTSTSGRGGRGNGGSATDKDWDAILEVIEGLLAGNVHVLDLTNGSVRLQSLGRSRSLATVGPKIPQALQERLQSESWANVWIAGPTSPNFASTRIPKVDSTTTFNAEKLVHDKLQTLVSLNSEYDPEQHWTSKHRSRAGYSKYRETKLPAATFTFPDPQCIFTYTLVRGGYNEASRWNANPPTYHVEVKASPDSRSSDFHLDNVQFERARRYTAIGKECEKVRDISILAWVYQKDGKLQLDFIPDPWSKFIAGKLDLTAVGGFIGSIRDPRYPDGTSPIRLKADQRWTHLLVTLLRALLRGMRVLRLMKPS